MSETCSPSLFNIGPNLLLQSSVRVCVLSGDCCEVCTRWMPNQYRHLLGTRPSYPIGVCMCTYMVVHFHMNYQCYWGCTASCVAIIFIDILASRVSQHLMWCTKTLSAAPHLCITGKPWWYALNIIIKYNNIITVFFIVKNITNDLFYCCYSHYFYVILA